MALDPKDIAKAYAPQLKLSQNELGRLAMRVQQDFRNALTDHQQRMDRFKRYYQAWRGRSDAPALGDEAESNYTVPIIQWQTNSKLASEMSQLLGDDAEIIAKPVGPSDQKKVKKISRYMTWLVFDSMQLPNKIVEFDFRRILNGRSHAYTPWERKTFWVPLAKGGMAEEVYYEGPGFDPLWPDDIVVPAEDVRSVQDFSFVLRKYRATPDDLLRGEDAGIYQGISANFQKYVDWSSSGRERDFESDVVKREKDFNEGVSYEGNLSAVNSIMIHEWYGKWRMLKGKQDGRENNLDRRQRYENELVVKYVPDMHEVIGVQDLAAMYPRSPERRPFADGGLTKDGSYWGMGFGEMLETIEDELSSNHNLMTSAGELSVGPILFYKPGHGFDPGNFQYQPKQAIPTDDPNSVKMIEIKANLEYPVAKEQQLITYSERVTGQTDMNVGRTQDTPNAPRTARQTLALLSEGDVRAELETNGLREDWARILSKFWELTTMFSPENQFFRVTEEQADGLFDVKDGGAYMTPEERGDRYDFDIRFATNAWSKETNKQNALALYQLDMTNPIVATNPRALWFALDKVHRAMGDDNFSDLIPMPPDPGLPIDPDVELTKLSEGEDVEVNPQDNDNLHITAHTKQIAMLAADPEHNPETLNALIRHNLAQKDQLATKQIMAQLAQQVVGQLQAQLGPQGMAQLQQGMIAQQMGGGAGGPAGPAGAPGPQGPAGPAQKPQQGPPQHAGPAHHPGPPAGVPTAPPSNLGPVPRPTVPGAPGSALGPLQQP